MSCPSAGNCTAVGADTGQLDGGVFVVTERNSQWRAALNRGGHAGVGVVSCPQPNRCTVAGSYTDRHGHTQAFVDSQAQ